MTGTAARRGGGHAVAVAELESLTVLDVKSSALDVEAGRIITATLADIDRAGVVANVRCWKFRVDTGISASATNTFGTEPVDRAEALDAETATRELLRALASTFDLGLPVVAHHAAHQFTVLDRETRRHALPVVVPEPVIDPFAIDKALDPHRGGSRRLFETARRHGVRLDAAQIASPVVGAIATGLLAWSLLDAFAARIGDGRGVVRDIHRVTARWEVGRAATAGADDPCATWPVLPRRATAR